MSSDAKIRVALIGLNAPPTGRPTGTSWAAAGHLPYLLTSKSYELVALQNSSVARATEAIAAYGLSLKTKAYGTPEEVSNDPDIDLVVSCIRVDRHSASLMPSILAGKDVFTEWPMEANLEKVRELTSAATKSTGRHVVGVQGRFSPLATKLRDLIAEGVIGKVESSTMVSHGYGGAFLPSPVDYFADRKIGGNLLTIIFGHTLEQVQQVLGNVSHSTSLLRITHPTVTIYDPVSQEVVDQARPSDVPDQIVLNAVLDTGTFLTYKLHGGPPFNPTSKPKESDSRPKIPAIEWRVFGTRGQIRITSYDSQANTWSLNHGPDLLQVEIYDAITNTLTQLPTVEDNYAHLPAPARNMARLYDAFARAKAGDASSWYPDFEYGQQKHDFIEKMYQENSI